MNRKLISSMFIFSLIALIVSTLILIENNDADSALENVCSATGSNCNAVQDSKYGEVLGFKVALIGVVAFALLTLIISAQIFSQKLKLNVQVKSFFEHLMIVGAFIAGFTGMYFIGLQMFVLRQYCIYCIIIDISSIIILILMVIYLKVRSEYSLDKRGKLYK